MDVWGDLELHCLNMEEDLMHNAACVWCNLFMLDSVKGQMMLALFYQLDLKQRFKNPIPNAYTTTLKEEFPSNKMVPINSF